MQAWMLIRQISTEEEEQEEKEEEVDQEAERQGVSCFLPFSVDRRRDDY